MVTELRNTKVDKADVVSKAEWAYNSNDTVVKQIFFFLI